MVFLYFVISCFKIVSICNIRISQYSRIKSYSLFSSLKHIFVGSIMMMRIMRRRRRRGSLKHINSTTKITNKHFVSPLHYVSFWDPKTWKPSKWCSNVFFLFLSNKYMSQTKFECVYFVYIGRNPRGKNQAQTLTELG